jgi:hypothetical protein
LATDDTYEVLAKEIHDQRCLVFCAYVKLLIIYWGLLILFLIAIFVIMDLTMALMPIQLIRTLNRPRSEKILVCGLMALGLLTTATVGAKMSAFPSVYRGDPLQGTVISSLLAKLEEQVGIICACLPTLKGPAERLLIRIGVFSSGFQHTMTRPSFVLSTRNRNAPAAPKSNQVDADLVSTADTEFVLDGSNSVITENLSKFPSTSASDSERTVTGKGSKRTLHSVEEV